MNESTLCKTCHSMVCNHDHANQVFSQRTFSDIDILPQLFPHLSSPADRPDCFPQPFPAKPGGPLPVPLPEGEEVEMFSHLQKSEITTNVSKILLLLPSLALGQGGSGVLLSAAESRREGDGRSHTAGEGGGCQMDAGGFFSQGGGNEWTDTNNRRL